MTPRIGQAVHYVLSQDDVDYISGQGTGLGVRGPVTAGQIVAAVITQVYGVQELGETGAPTGTTRTAVNLQVTLDGERNIWRQDVPQGTTNGCWYLPAPDQAGVDLAGFYSQQIQPVIAALTARLDALSARVDQISTPASTPPASTPPATPTGAAPTAIPGSPVA